LEGDQPDITPRIHGTSVSDAGESAIVMSIVGTRTLDELTPYKAQFNDQPRVLDEGMFFQERSAVLLSLLSAIKTLHSWSIVHGDLKPSNVRVSQPLSGNLVTPIRVWLVDFGSSTLFGGLNENCATTGFRVPKDRIEGRAQQRQSPVSDLVAFLFSCIRFFGWVQSEELAAALCDIFGLPTLPTRQYTISRPAAKSGTKRRGRQVLAAALTVSGSRTRSPAAAFELALPQAKNFWGGSGSNKPAAAIDKARVVLLSMANIIMPLTQSTSRFSFKEDVYKSLERVLLTPR
jgi:serine/threonine protein kinase